MKKITSISLLQRLRPLWRLRLIISIVAVAGLCAYLVFTINQSVTISGDPVAAAQSRGPRIDPTLAQKLQQLQDNSVSVKALFNEARDNPFSN